MNGQYSPNEEKILENIRGALSGEEVTDTPVPTSDDEKHLDDILKAAQGEEPLYNLPANWNHQKRLVAIKEAIQGGGGGGGGSSTGSLVIYQDEETYTLDKTWQEIMDAVSAGTPAYVYIVRREFGPISEIDINLVSVVSGSFVSDYYVKAGEQTYTVDGPDSYPHA